VASNARLDSHKKREIIRQSHLQAVCWIPFESRQWPWVFHHWSFSIGSQRRAFSLNQDRFIPGNPSSAIFKYPHPRCFSGPGNQLRKPRIYGRSSYSNNKKYNRELSQHSNCRGCVRVKARIFFGRFSGNRGQLGYGDWHKIPTSKSRVEIPCIGCKNGYNENYVHDVWLLKTKCFLNFYCLVEWKLSQLKTIN